MQTEPDSSPQPNAESAVGLTFVAVVLVSVFVAGSLGVVATREAAQAVDPGQEPEATAVAAASTAAMQVRDRIVTRFSELMLLREIALRERDPRCSSRLYASGAAGLAKDGPRSRGCAAPAAASTACACRSRCSAPTGRATAAGW